LLNTTKTKHAFQSLLAIIRKKYICHGTGSASVCIRKFVKKIPWICVCWRTRPQSAISALEMNLVTWTLGGETTVLLELELCLHLLSQLCMWLNCWELFPR